MKLLWCFACAICAVCSACNGPSQVRPLSPEARAVRVAALDPPPHALPLGPIEASDGSGCGLRGEPGSLDNATGRLRELAARRGANYVKLIRVQQPYSEHDCYHVEFKVEGLSFRLSGTPPTPSAPRPGAAEHSSANTPCVQSARVGSEASSALVACVPACAAGYRCEAGACNPECSPSCEAGFICRADRVCVPAPPP